MRSMQETLDFLSDAPIFGCNSTLNPRNYIFHASTSVVYSKSNKHVFTDVNRQLPRSAMEQFASCQPQFWDRDSAPTARAAPPDHAHGLFGICTAFFDFAIR